MRKLKALGFFAIMMVLLFILCIGVIAEVAPAMIPDWMYTAGQIISIPFWIVFFVVTINAWRNQRKAKKEE